MAASPRGVNLTPPPLGADCLFQIKDYEKLDSEEERLSRSRQIYDVYIMKELLSCSHVRLPRHCFKIYFNLINAHHWQVFGCYLRRRAAVEQKIDLTAEKQIIF